VIWSGTHRRHVRDRHHDRLEPQVGDGAQVQVDVNSGHHQVSGEKQWSTTGIADHGRIVTDPELTGWSRSSRCGLESGPKRSNYLKFIGASSTTSVVRINARRGGRPGGTVLRSSSA
jgi:hypothetical protein